MNTLVINNSCDWMTTDILDLIYDTGFSWSIFRDSNGFYKDSHDRIFGLSWTFMIMDFDKMELTLSEDQYFSLDETAYTESELREKLITRRGRMIAKRMGI